MKKIENENPGGVSWLPLLAAAAFSLLFLYSTDIYAGNKADFSGEWTLNEDKSDVGESRFGPSKTLKVAQDENSLVLERTRTGREGQEMTIKEEYTLDGKEQLSDNERGTTRTTASWSEDGKTLYLNSHRKMTRDGQTFEITTNEIWELSDDGSSLTIQSSRTSSRGDVSSVLVYQKRI